MLLLWASDLADTPPLWSHCYKTSVKCNRRNCKETFLVGAQTQKWWENEGVVVRESNNIERTSLPFLYRAMRTWKIEKECCLFANKIFVPFKQISDFLTSGSLTLAGVLLLSYCNPFWGLILVIYLLLYLDWMQKRAKEENTSSCHIYLGLAIFGDFYILVAIDFLAEGKLKVNLTLISVWTSYFLRVKFLPMIYHAVFVVSKVVFSCVQCSCDIFC